MTQDRLTPRLDLLIRVLDTLVPSEKGFPESGALAVDHVLALAAASGEAEALLARALDAVESGARALDPAGFAALSPDRREELLRNVERQHPAPFEALVRHTYDGFYSHPATVARLGLPPGPVQPRGHPIEDAPLPDLARIRARGPIYRRA